MCGSVGLFIGCAALSVCPRALLGEAVHDTLTVGAEATPAPYRSPFTGWDDRASVRNAPRRRYTDEDAQLPPIAADLVPVAGDPRVRALDPTQQRGILLHHLYRYLDFTAALESLVVNRTVLGIANGSVGVQLPRQMRLDAYRIYCDESYHALFSADLCQQVEQVTGVPAGIVDRPYFLTRLEALLSRVEPSMRPLIELLFVIVSETLISAMLAENLSGGQPMAESVRSAIRDHAVDEGRHHAYFASFLRHLWPQLGSAERRLAGEIVPELAAIFLDPDSSSVCRDLVRAGVPRAEAELIVAETYGSERVAEQQREVGRQTLRHFADVGAFTDLQYDDLVHHGGVSA